MLRVPYPLKYLKSHVVTISDQPWPILCKLRVVVTLRISSVHLPISPNRQTCANLTHLAASWVSLIMDLCVRSWAQTASYRKKQFILLIKRISEYSRARIALGHRLETQRTQTETNSSRSGVAPSKIKSFPSQMLSWPKWMTSRRLSMERLPTRCPKKALRKALSIWEVEELQMKTLDSLSPIRPLIDK